jgi:UTP--glucose-1-phosphate uridylyltransferase
MAASAPFVGLSQPQIFDILSAKETGTGGEIQIADAMIRLIETQPFYAFRYEG